MNRLDPTLLAKEVAEEFLNALKEQSNQRIHRKESGRLSIPRINLQIRRDTQNPISSMSYKKEEEKSSNRVKLDVDVGVVQKMKTRAKVKDESLKNAGRDWFHMDPKLHLTDEEKREFRALSLRGYTDPSSHTFTDRKKESKYPKYFQFGTVVEQKQEFYSDRISKKDRKKSLAEEILMDSHSRQYSKKKYTQLQKGRENKRKKEMKTRKKKGNKRRGKR